jgi:HEAT repeat protein
MAARWLVPVWAALAAGPMAAQPVMPAPQAPPAAPPSGVTPPAGQPKPFEWPKTVGDKPLDHWIGLLDSPDPTVRETAIKTVPLFGPAARKAVPKLIARLDDPDPGPRVNAIIAVYTVGVEGKDDVQKAVRSLTGSINGTREGSVIRLYAARCLGAIGPDAHTAVPALALLTKDPAWETRDAAAAALGRAGAPVFEGTPPGGAPPQPKRPANPTARSRLTDLLKDPSRAVRLEAIQSLLLLGPPTTQDPNLYVKEAQPLIDPVLARLAPGTDKAPGEKDPGVRMWLNALVLMYDDRHEPKAFAEMAAAVAAADPELRVQGLTAMAMLGGKAGKAIDTVRAALGASEPAVAKAAVACVLALPPADGRKAAPDLQRLAASAADEELKAFAAEAVKRLQPGAAPPPAGKK